MKKTTTGNAGVTRSLGYFLYGIWGIVAPSRLEALGVTRSLEPAGPPTDSSDPQRHQEAQGRYLVGGMGVSALWPSDPSHNGGTFSSPGKAATPGQYLADLSLRFAGQPDHHAALSRFCKLADLYHQQHGMAVGEAVSRAFTGTLVEYGDGGAVAMLRPEILDKLPRPSAPLQQQQRFTYRHPPQNRTRVSVFPIEKSRKGRQQQEADCDG